MEERKAGKGERGNKVKRRNPREKNLFLVLSARDYLSLQWLASADLHVD